MKTLWIVLSLVIGITHFAGFARAEDAKKGEKFEARKAEILTRIDGHIKKMQEHRACVSAASNHEALKKCRETMKAFHEQQRAQGKGHDAHDE